MRALSILVALGVLSGCSSIPRGAAASPSGGAFEQEPTDTASEPSALVAGGECRQGAATYYADALAGHRTASGERYDPGAMTAAHRSLPFGTWLRVRWQGREVKVRVNDRGGPRGGVDLSRVAAEHLHMIRAGRVKAQICSGG